MATHSSILAWKIPWTEEPGGLQFMGSQKVKTAERLSTHTHTHTSMVYPNLQIHPTRFSRRVLAVK